MSELDRLIQELCPEGVEYKMFGELATIQRGGSPRPIQHFITNDSNGINWIKIGDVAPGGKYITSTKEKIIKEGMSKSRLVKPGDFVLSNSMSFGRPYILKTEGCIHDGWLVISNFANHFIPDFLYYLLGSNIIQKTMAQRASSGTVSNLNAEIVRSIELPIPPLSVQREIVRILDKFTAATTELQALLKQELALRKKQYAYYRDQLLTFGDEVPRVALGEIGEIIRGSGLQKSDFTDNGVGCIHYGQIYTHYGTFTSETKSFVPPELAAKLKKVNPSDIIIAVTSENVEDVCKCVAWLGEDEIVTGGHSAIFKHKQNPKYIAYYLQTTDFFTQKRKIVNGTKVIEVSTKKLESIIIPLPSLSEQARIVSILDRFDALTNDLVIGLPAEIAARQKQYEYYRDKLLCFTS
jgi:type I restriction enzyme S subunit